MTWQAIDKPNANNANKSSKDQSMCESAQRLQCFPCQFCLLEIDQKNFKKLYLAKENIPRYKSQKEKCFAPFSSLGKPSDTLKRLA